MKYNFQIPSTKHQIIFNVQNSNFKVTWLLKIVILNLFGIWNLLFGISVTSAVVDPLASPNNKFGIHIISATHDESSPAASLVNSSGGDWGYITVLIEKNDRKKDKWQLFFDDLRRRHLIPIVRIATEPEGNFWKVPTEGEENIWAEFLNSLNWPTKNRYITVYNEPNQGQEWGGKVDAAFYAQVLDKTISAFKGKSEDFFMLNAGLDASAPQKFPLYQDEMSFLREMNQAVPGILNKLDGWTSHSYPNPGFAGSPSASGKGTVRTWLWEMNQLQGLGVNKKLPIFITETGWKHAEGKNYDKSLPSSEVVGNYFKEAFANAWNDNRIVAVTPFLLTYQDVPFDHFSFKKLSGEPQNLKILGASYPDYYPQYQAMMEIPKGSGQPVQENKAQLIKGEIYSSLVGGETYTIPLTFKNTGQSIWGEGGGVELRDLKGSSEFNINSVPLEENMKIEPGKEHTFTLRLKAPSQGDYHLTLQLFNGGKAFDQEPLEFNIQVKSPVILWVNAALNWKKKPTGNYVLSVSSDAMKSNIDVPLDEQGASKQLEARYLLPDYAFDFTLYRPFYKPKTINLKVKSGVNTLDFGTLEPDFLSALLKPKQLWNILPFSN